MSFHVRSVRCLIGVRSVWLLSLAMQGSCMNVSTPGYRCHEDGVCTREPVCGDGTKAPEEQCDDGNTIPDDGCSATCRDQVAPEFGIVFPGRRSTTNAPRVTVRGVATDEHGSGVHSVQVEGALATFDREQWWAEIELEPGSIMDTVRVSSDDMSGNVNEDDVGVAISYAPIIELLSVKDVGIWNRDVPQALVVDDDLDALVSIDLMDGTHRILSGDHHGHGVRFQRPEVIAIDDMDDRAFVIDAENDTIVAIDLQTGDRSLLEDSSDGGIAFVSPRDMAMDPDRGRLLVVDAVRDELIAVDLQSGTRTVVTLENAGTGATARFYLGDIDIPKKPPEDPIRTHPADPDPVDPSPGVDPEPIQPEPSEPPLLTPGSPCDPAGASLHNPVGIIVKDDRAFINDECQRVISVNLTNRQIVGRCHQIPTGVVMLPREQDVLIFDPGLLEVFSIDLTDCSRMDEEMPSLDSSDALGLVAPGNMAIDSAGNRAIVIDTFFQELFILDLSSDDLSSDHTLTSLRGGSTGMGPRLWGPRGLAVDWEQERAYVVDQRIDALFRIDLQDGTRTIVSDMAAQPLENPRGITLDPNGKDVLIVDVRDANDGQGGSDDQGALIAVDRESGDCRTISGPDRIGGQVQGAGLGLRRPLDIAAMKDRNVAYVVDWGLNALFEIDLETGDRTVVSDEEHGSGPPIAGPLGIALDNGGLHAYVTLQEGGAVLKIDLETGDRTVVSDEAKGLGPFLHVPMDIALDSSADDHEILILDLDIEGVVSVDAESGDRMGISGALIGSGPLLTGVASIAIDAVRDLALLVDAHLNALVLVDLVTGDRVIVSR
jgi:cysteine-rich repeat protein